MAVLQILAIATAIAVVCALLCAKTHRFYLCRQASDTALARLKKAPVWCGSFLAGNSREKRRLRDQLATMKGALPLLMKQRQGGAWSADEKKRHKGRSRPAG